MNQARRDKCEEISKKLDVLHTELEALKDEEIEANENKPEAMQDSSAGDALSNACDSISDVQNYLEEAVGA